MRAFAETPALSLDTFARPDQDGWGTASDGHIWQDDRAVQPGARARIQRGLGYVDTYSANVDLDCWMGDCYTDALISADFQLLNYRRGERLRGARLLGRVTDQHQFLVFAMNFANATVQLWVNHQEQWWMLRQEPAPAFRIRQWYHARLLVLGAQAAGKVWAAGAAEPDWQIVGQQEALTAGRGGLRTTYSQVYWANFRVQAITPLPNLAPLPGERPDLV